MVKASRLRSAVRVMWLSMRVSRSLHCSSFSVSASCSSDLYTRFMDWRSGESLGTSLSHIFRFPYQSSSITFIFLLSSLWKQQIPQGWRKVQRIFDTKNLTSPLPSSYNTPTPSPGHCRVREWQLLTTYFATDTLGDNGTRGR